MQDPVVIKTETVNAIEEATTKPKRNHKGPYTTENGVVLKYRKVSSQLIYKAWSSLKIPEVPMVWIEDRGRDEPNPYDPGYLNQLQKYQHDKTHVSTLIFFTHGIDVFSIPDNLISIDSDEWFEPFKEWVDIPTTKEARKAAWLMYYAIPDDNEQGEILADLMILNGMVLARTVDEALNTFRGDEGAEVDTAASSTS